MQTATEEPPLEGQLRQQVQRRKLPPPPMRRALREAAGVSTTAVAQQCGVTHQSVSAWERGLRNPSGPRLERYLALLDRLAKEAS